MKISEIFLMVSGCAADRIFNLQSQYDVLRPPALIYTTFVLFNYIIFLCNTLLLVFLFNYIILICNKNLY